LSKFSLFTKKGVVKIEGFPVGQYLFAHRMTDGNFFGVSHTPTGTRLEVLGLFGTLKEAIAQAARVAHLDWLAVDDKGQRSCLRDQVQAILKIEVPEPTQAQRLSDDDIASSLACWSGKYPNSTAGGTLRT
jgi:hypothetical protein